MKDEGKETEVKKTEAPSDHLKKEKNPKKSVDIKNVAKAP